MEHTPLKYRRRSSDVTVEHSLTAHGHNDLSVTHHQPGEHQEPEIITADSFRIAITRCGDDIASVHISWKEAPSGEDPIYTNPGDLPP